MKQTHLKKLYTKTYFQNTNSSVFGYDDYLADEEKIRKTFKKRLRRIEDYKKKGNILDLGCATGFFLDEAKKRGFRVNGVELSAFAASYANTKLKISVKNSDILSASFKPKSFDVITMWDVIEHIPNPQETLKKIYSWLKDDGVLVFATPDVGSIPARLTGYRWIGYKLSDEHLSYFSLETLTKLLEKAGFTIQESHHLGKFVSYNLFSDRIGIYSNLLGKFLKLFGKLIPSRFSFYMSAFDIICIYAHKKNAQE
jgi:2-polyprenyl-3-methyl-5-hydroxy-6-metoxy-1,4-benzoquinol methylase